jgi:hypothetical protein
VRKDILQRVCKLESIKIAKAISIRQMSQKTRTRTD